MSMKKIVSATLAASFCAFVFVARPALAQVADREETVPVTSKEEAAYAKWWKNLCQEKNQCRVNFWGLSHHPHAKYDFNERNWGIGLRYNAKWNLFGERWYVQMNTVKNSVRGGTLIVGGGAEYPVLNVGDMPLYLGGELSWMKYEHPLRHKTITGMLAVPTASLELSKDFTLHSFIIPSRDQRHPVTAFVFYGSVPFDAFFRLTR